MKRRAWLLWLLAAAACSSPGGDPPVDKGASKQPRAVATAAAPASTGSSAPASASAAVAASTPEPAAPGACKDTAGVQFYPSPRSPAAGQPLRLLAISGKPLAGTLRLRDDQGKEIATGKERHGGPPFWWYAEVASPGAGTYRAELGGSCTNVSVEAAPRIDAKRAWNAAWPVRTGWSAPLEDFYSAWIEKLFDAPLEKQLAWPALHEVLRDRDRNFLHGYLGLQEDDTGRRAIKIDPDCADLPYFLRAYFAFKLGLPFGYSACTRGGGGQPPRCMRWHSNLERNKTRRQHPFDAFGDFLRVTLANAVHSGTGRTAAEDDRTDYYSVPLSFEHLRPGTIYADPYGHILIVAKRIAGTKDGGGVLLAVDGQPDGTVSRRRFWRGNFLFAADRALGSPGFKRFRPVVVEKGRARALTNQEIKKNADYGDFSLDQYALTVDGFYDRMDDVLSPIPLDPAIAMRETIDTFEEQVKGRVLSVQNGQSYLAKGGKGIEMPEGPAIFETTGAWEDFSTPSRDLRLLIAIDVVTGFPARVARRAARYKVAAGRPSAEVQKELEAVLEAELLKRRFSYARSDGSSFELSLRDVVERASKLEMAYNPNDCVEIRWGAPAKSDEAKTCRRRAPADQVAQMRKHRAWFRERKRPPRS
jgi:hypothetical protein